MNIIRHKVYIVEFDVWEPQEKKVQDELDFALNQLRRHLSHVGNLKIAPRSEERIDAEIR